MSVNVNLFRGGMPVYKGIFCNREFPEFELPIGTPHMPATPPFNSHADAAHGQGYLNLHFPFVPMLGDTMAHHWMGKALRSLSAVGDRIFTNIVPQRSFITDLYWEVTQIDEALEGVYLKPIAARVSWDFDAKDWVWEDNDDYTTMLTAGGVTQFPLGSTEDGDARYAYVHCSDTMCTFGHDIATYTNGAPTAGLDDYFGAVVLGYEISEGDEDKIALIWKSHFALYSSCKCLTFEGAAQV